MNEGLGISLYLWHVDGGGGHWPKKGQRWAGQSIIAEQAKDIPPAGKYTVQERPQPSMGKDQISTAELPPRLSWTTIVQECF